MYFSVCFWLGMVRWMTTSSSLHASPVTSRSMQVGSLHYNTLIIPHSSTGVWGRERQMKDYEMHGYLTVSV